ncbi:MAG: sensor histidine kinase [Longimicrobiales bacterium]
MGSGRFLPRLDARRQGRALSATTWLVPFLAATLGFSLWLGWQALDAVRSHREAAESALRDYAQMAAWQYAGMASDRLDDLLDDAFDDVRFGNRRPPLPAAAEVLDDIDRGVRRLDCECPALRRPAFRFHTGLGNGIRPVARPEEVPQAILNALADTIALYHRALSRHRFAILPLPAGFALDSPSAAIYTVSQNEDDPIRAAGIVVPARALSDLFGRWFEEAELLPPAITGETPNDSLLHVSVHAASGEVYYHSSVHFATTLAVRDTLVHEFGPLVVEASVRPDAADRLIIGGLPQSKLPLIIGLLLLTLGVGAVGLFQIGRERQLARLRDDFISGVSHELRTPLAQIRMFAELHESGKLRTEDDRVRAIAVIHRESRRLTHLVDNILRFARIRRTLATGMVREEIDVSTAISELAHAFRPLAAARRMTLDVRVEPDLAVSANADALNQILINLLDNAAKYGPAGQTIRLTVERMGEWARFTVDDEGPGVPSGERRRIFEPYFRLDRERDSRLPGTGIGLAVVAQLADMHDGRVRVEDTGQGSARFVVELPIVHPRPHREPLALAERVRA